MKFVMFSQRFAAIELFMTHITLGFRLVVMFQMETVGLSPNDPLPAQGTFENCFHVTWEFCVVGIDFGIGVQSLPTG